MLFEEMMRDEGLKEGLEKGRREGILSLLQDFGEVPEDIQFLIMNEEEINLKELNRMAARAESLDDFRSKLEKSKDK